MPEWLNFFLRQMLLIAVVLVLHTYIGLHIIRRTLIFSDLALDQLAAFGALVALAISGVALYSPASYMASLVMVLVGALILAAVKPKSDAIPREAVIGIVYAITLTATIVLTDVMPSGDVHLKSSMQGNLDWVSWDLVFVTAGVYAVLLIVHFVLRRHFIALAEKPETVSHPLLWDFFFFATQGVITVLIVPVAGVFLAYVFLMLPAAVAAMFTRRWGRALALGWSVGFVSCAVGLTTSYHTGWPYSPSVVLAMGGAFFVAIILRIRRRHMGAVFGKGEADVGHQ